MSMCIGLIVGGESKSVLFLYHIIRDSLIYQYFTHEKSEVIHIIFSSSLQTLRMCLIGE
jgi:hypothetical protein